MYEERKVNVCEGLPLNSTSTGAANIFLNTGKNTKAKSDGTVIHLNTEKPADVGVHINTTLSIASSKKIRLLFVLNFLLCVICIIISSSIAFYYWNELISMRRQLDTIKDQFLIQNLRNGGNLDSIQSSALVSHLRPGFRGSDIREARMDSRVEISPNTRKYYVEDLGEDMLLVDSSKKGDKNTPVPNLPIFHKAPLVIHFNGALDEKDLGTNHEIGPWQRDLDVSTKDSDNKIELNSDGNTITVKEGGLYLIYAQITYISHTPNCYFLWATKNKEKSRLLTACSTGDDSSKRPPMQSQMTCFAQTVARLYEGDVINFAQREPNRIVWLRRGLSYFGFVKLSS